MTEPRVLDTLQARGSKEFAELLDDLAFQHGDAVTVCHKPVGGVFAPIWTTVKEAPEVVAGLVEDSDVWFNVNGLRPRASGRGRAEDVIRLSALWLDLDVKQGGMPSGESALAVVSTLSEMLGPRPTRLIWSGHGWQAFWAVDPEDSAAEVSDDNRPAVVALLRRFGRLAAHVAASHGGRIDSVFDLARIMRVPGTFNRKDPGEPIAVTMQPQDGYPLTVAEIDEQLITFGAVERSGDRDVLGTVVAPRGDWLWAEETDAAVHRAIASWGQQKPPARHPWLLGCATSLAYARRLGMITEVDHQTAVTTLTARFSWLLEHTGEPRAATAGEVTDCFDFGVAVAEQKTDDDARQDWAFWHEKVALDRLPTRLGSVRSVPGIDQFWVSRPVLTRIHDFARARMCSAWAVLGVVLARVVVSIPPDVVLPPIVGSDASLNLFVALTGPSGSGKGAAEAVAADAVLVGYPEIATIGSGEGMAHLYAHREKGAVIRDRDAVLFTVPEVDNLTALGRRQGATLMPQLRMAWMGEALGFSYADRQKSLPIERHSYRMAMVLGVQPGRARPLLDDADGGTPQRFLWVPTTDPDAPDTEPDCPDTWGWKKPQQWTKNQHGRAVMAVTDVARDAIKKARRAALRGESAALDGHALLTRLKVAAALALLDERQGVSEDDWDLAGIVMAVSDKTRDYVGSFLAAQDAGTNRARAEAEGTRAVVIDQKREDHQAQRVAQVILRALLHHGRWVTHADIRRRAASRDRATVDEALARLVDVGDVEGRADGKKLLYRARAR